MKTAENYIEMLRRYTNAYYNLREPEVSDRDYDALKNEFMENYPDHPFLKKLEYTTETSAKAAKLNHEHPMYSYLSVNNVTDFREWANRVSNDGMFCVSERIEGLSVSVTYLQGRFYKAVAKGDGKTGDDVSKQVKAKLPQKLPVEISITLKGVLSDSIYFYEVLGNMVFRVEHQKFDYIKNILKLNTPWYKQAALEEVVKVYGSYAYKNGLVVKVDSLIQQEMLNLGSQGEGEPEHTVKFLYES